MQKIELNEITVAPYSPYYCHAIISIITGYDLEEIREHKPAGERFFTRDFKRIIAELGFNCAQRFTKFDPATTHASILRCYDTTLEDRKGWLPLVYYDGIIYDPVSGKFPLARLNPDYVITSYLPVYF
jgi:hypothetical protein